MQFNIKSVALLSVVTLGNLASAQTIAYGQELQNNDQTNHWVTWIDGQHACAGQQVLGVLTQNHCGQPSNLGEVEYKFSGCSGDGPPTAILDCSGIQIGTCSDNSSDKINCHGGLHDIIKHGTCTVQNGSKSRVFPCIKENHSHC